MIRLKGKIKELFRKVLKKDNNETAVEFRQMRCPYSNFICLQFPLRTEEEKRDPKIVCDRCKVKKERENDR